MPMTSRPRIAIPGDDPPQLQDSPHLRRLRAVGDVVLYRDRPIDDEEKVRGQTAPIVAEHALALMLATARRVAYQTRLMRQGGWRTADNLYLRDKLLGVVGTGPIGAELARLGRAIGMRVQAWTFHPTPE